MTNNFPLGLDGGDPGIVSAMCESLISGGAAVTVSGAVNLVNASGNSSFTTSDMVVKTAGASNFIGFATQTTASGNPIGIATKGAFIVNAGSAVTVGAQVEYIAASESFKHGVTAGNVVGKALTGASSGGQFVLRIGY